MNTSKEQLQENQYTFPYHHLAHFENDGIYVFRHLFWGLEHITYISFVINKIKEHDPNSIVDIGCGEGRIISELISSFEASKLQGFDISEKAIGFARAFVPKVEFNIHDIILAPLPKKYDSAVSCEVIEHIEPEKVRDYCKNIADSLNSGGSLFLTTPTTNVPTNRKHYQHFTKESLEEHLSPFFDIVEVSYLNCVNSRSRLLNRLIANKFYISNFKCLNRFVLQQYKRKLLIGDSETGSRIYIKAVKK